MIYSQPSKNDIIPYSTVKIDGCSEAKLGFDFLSEQPSIGKRRYCNKVLVHECITVPEIKPLEVERVEFLATSDSCYQFFEIFKSSDDVDEDNPATIELQKDTDDKTIGIIVSFDGNETCGLPLTLAYKVYAYLENEDERVLISNGTLCVTPCCCSEGAGTTPWVDVRW